MKWNACFVHCVILQILVMLPCTQLCCVKKASRVWLWQSWTIFDSFFEENITKKVGNKSILIFQLANVAAFALLCETGNSKIVYFSLKCCMLFWQQTMQNTLKLSLSHPSLRNLATVCIRQQLQSTTSWYVTCVTFTKCVIRVGCSVSKSPDYCRETRTMLYVSWNVSWFMVMQQTALTWEAHFA